MPMQTAGVHHVGLSVTNVKRSKDFYMDLFGWKEVGADQKLGYGFLSDGKNTITPWHQSQSGYNRTHAGLHHLALAVNGIEELMRAERMLRKKKIRIHYDRIVPITEGTQAAELYFFDPDGICVELFSDAGDEGLQPPVQHGPSCLLGKKETFMAFNRRQTEPIIAEIQCRPEPGFAWWGSALLNKYA